MIYKTLYSIVMLCLFGNISNAQSLNGKLIDLSRAYNKYMYEAKPPKNLAKDLESEAHGEIATAAAFIAQAISPKNKLTKPEHLTLPDDNTLKYIYIIKALSDNISSNSPADNNALIEQLVKKNVMRYETVDNYYSMLFLSMGYKNKASSYSDINFTLDSYGLKDDTEKAIFFLRCMEKCGNTIYHYIHEVQPSNTQIALRYARKFPKFNGEPYYMYNKFDFYDFGIVIDPKDGTRSYKTYYMSLYYNTLMDHLICLNKQGGTDKEKKDLMDNSILTNRSFYKYSKKEAILNGMFYPDIVNGDYGNSGSTSHNH